MDLNNYFLFISIAFAYIVSPGPAVFIAINYGATFQFKKPFILLIGNTLGLGILAFISAIGVGAIIISSPLLSAISKVLGALFLIYLGLKILRQTKYNFTNESNYEEKDLINYFKEGLVLSLSNPKPIIFFLSIYPQFIEYNQEQTMQFFILGFSFMVISFISLNIYSLLSKYTLGKVLNESRVRFFNLFSGILLAGMGFLLLVQN